MKLSTCEWCGKKFAKINAAVSFAYCDPNHSRPHDYEKLTKVLCGDCAASVIFDKVDGVYFQTCDFCGKKFDVYADDLDFYNHFSYLDGEDLLNHWDDGVCCSSCALNRIEKKDPNYFAPKDKY